MNYITTVIRGLESEIPVDASGSGSWATGSKTL